MGPKDKFIASTERADWERITETKAAELAKDYALLQFVVEQEPGESPATAWDRHSQLVGARRVLDILFNLHLKEEPKKPIKMQRLPIPQ